MATKNGWVRVAPGKWEFYQNGRVFVRVNSASKPSYDPTTPKPKPAPATPPPVAIPVPGPIVAMPPVDGYGPVSPSRDFGLDLLGAAKYPQVVLNEFPAGWWIGVFSSTFGDSRPVVQALLASGRLKGVKVHLAWKDNHSFSQADFPAIREEARKWKALVDAYPGVLWAFSGACEHKLQPAVSLQLMNVVLSELPGAIYINSGPAIPSSPRVWNEIHEPPGQQNAPAMPGFFSYSFDGSSCVNEDVTERKNTMNAAQVFFFWVCQFNGKARDDEKSDRAKRTHWPTSPLLDAVIYLSREKGPTQLVSGITWKAVCEELGDARSFKPVCLVNTKARALHLVADNGQVIATASRYPTNFRDGRARFYFPDYGFNLAEKAKRIQGHPICRLIGDGIDFGRVNPSCRDGNFK